MKDLRLKENEVVHCSTYKQAKKVLKLAKKLGVNKTNKFLTLWDVLKEETCYNMQYEGGLIYDRVSYYKDFPKEIITAKEFLARHKSSNVGSEVTITIINAGGQIRKDVFERIGKENEARALAVFDGCKPLDIDQNKVGKTLNYYKSKVIQWGKQRGLYNKEHGATEDSQLIKFFEEFGELSQGLIKNDNELIKDAIGDCQVVLIHLCKLKGLSIEEMNEDAFKDDLFSKIDSKITTAGLMRTVIHLLDLRKYNLAIGALCVIERMQNFEFLECLDFAYNEIKDRKGKMINRTFVKDEQERKKEITLDKQYFYFVGSLNKERRKEVEKFLKANSLNWKAHFSIDKNYIYFDNHKGLWFQTNGLERGEAINANTLFK